MHSKFVILFILFFSCTSCLMFGYENVDPSVKEALNFYRKGSVRRAAEVFERNPNIVDNPELQFIWAKSYLEMKEYRKAFEIFYKIDAEEMYKNKRYSYIYPFFVRKYIETLIQLDDPDLLTKEEQEKTAKMIGLVDKDSPIRKYMDKQLFSILWKYNDLDTILSLDKNLSQYGQAWLEIAKYAKGMSYNLPLILDAYEILGNNTVYSNVLASIDSKSVNSAKDAKTLARMSLRVKNQRNRALEFADRYVELSGDREYYTLVEADVLRLDGSHNDSALLLYDYIISNTNVSPKFYTNTHRYLVQRKYYDLADDIAQLAYSNHNQKFYHDVKDAIEFSKNAQYTLSWYKKNYKKIQPDIHNAAIRALIRSDIKLAEQAVDIGINYNLNNANFVLMHGLIKEYFKKPKEAYQSYLRLIFQDAFGYAGIVARQKERKLRNQYRSIFDKAVKKIQKELPFYKIQDRLIVNKALSVDSELVQYADKAMMKRDQKKLDKKIYKDLLDVPKISLLEKYNPHMSNLAPETQDYVENSVFDVVEDQSNRDIARYYYRYKEILLNSEIVGQLTFRLYFYARDIFGAPYLPVLPKEMIELIFPKLEFNTIESLSDNNKDLAYWMLSSFMAESHFRKRVYSSVGAVGFAQVMPYTAKDIKKWMKKPCFSNYDFYDNLMMGVYYHYKMYKIMDNDIILSLAAYNAGPGAVHRWKKNYPHFDDIYLFVEAIPIEETRNYVKTITYNHGMYRLLYDYEDLLYPK
ncbi:MAG: lytic transglycosylase domain-containing protein [Brevinemataceae bacterium]